MDREYWLILGVFFRRWHKCKYPLLHGSCKSLCFHYFLHEMEKQTLELISKMIIKKLLVRPINPDDLSKDKHFIAFSTSSVVKSASHVFWKFTSTQGTQPFNPCRSLCGWKVGWCHVYFQVSAARWIISCFLSRLQTTFPPPLEETLFEGRLAVPADGDRRHQWKNCHAWLMMIAVSCCCR